MKSKKIISALSALVMGATMMAGTAMSASAISISNTNPQLYGGFCAQWQGANFTPAPYGMYDGEIFSATYNSATGKYDLVLQAIPGYGSLIGITTVQLNKNDYASDQEYLDAINAINLIDDDEVSLYADTTYYYYASTHHNGSPFQFKTSTTESSLTSH